MKRTKLELLKYDRYFNMMEAVEHLSLKHIFKIDNWPCVWDQALVRGCAATVAVQKIIHFLGKAVFVDQECQNCPVTT